MSTQLSADLASLKINREKPSGRGKSVVYVLLGILVIAGLSVSGVLAWPYMMAKVFKTEVEFSEVMLVSPIQASVGLTATGYVIPQTISKVGSKIQGRIQKILVKQGDHVKAGDALLMLDESEQKSAILAGKARLFAARARIQTARANLKETKLQLQRAEQLLKQGAEAQARVEDLAAHASSLASAVQAAISEAKAAESDLETLQINLGLLRIHAPISGTVVTKPPEMGEVVTPQAPLLELVDFSSLVVETDIPEARLDKIKVDMPCEIVLDAFPQKRFRGRMLEIVPKLNRAKAAAIVKVRFQDPPDGVLPEMAARVSFLTNELDQKMMTQKPKTIVPKNTLTTRQGQKVVFVVHEDQVKMVNIILGEQTGDGYELKEGPSPGTKLVKNPPNTLADGQKIKEKAQD